MSRRKSRTTRTTFCLASLLGLFLSGLPMQVLAQNVVPGVQGQPGRTQPPTRLAPPILEAKAPVPTSRKRLPGRRQPAGGRGCDFKMPDKPLTALIPETNLGLTTATHPTFFFYIPQTSATAARFVLLDEENETRVYETTLSLPSNPGIVSISLPADKTLPALKVGKEYHWYLSILCVPEERDGDIYVDGWIQRVEPNSTLSSLLDKASSGKQVAVYQKNDLWHDTLTTLAEQRRSKPKDSALTTEWANLLSSEGLDGIAREPLVGSFPDGRTLQGSKSDSTLSPM